MKHSQTPRSGQNLCGAAFPCRIRQTIRSCSTDATPGTDESSSIHNALVMMLIQLQVGAAQRCIYATF